MSAARLLLALALTTTLASSCARRNRNIPAAKSEATPAPAPVVASSAARDLTDVLTDELNLTGDQPKQVRAIFTETAEKANAAQRQYSANRPAMMAELKRINANSDKELQQVLTASQYQKLKVKQRQVQEQMRARKANK
ncbi:hypothetical protein HMJ29_05375 [Hymenobacter taeanensis]|uniref:DUF4168 domain-containing protein n=1 Tax=Hymenobacter taeanensis TaxID=2735321 RepID=A0A6M6BH89_9BACT|nr:MULTISPECIES: hypothetical protein [Hymenobacter]QJX46395.1 hypothetical protein HMJ29_05375 [Hymenobacter taeanensis]UOQ80256.1 hypothetical protein MUN83_15690 [Hymenobacter sp. 5414T-23]